MNPEAKTTINEVGTKRPPPIVVGPPPPLLWSRRILVSVLISSNDAASTHLEHVASQFLDIDNRMTLKDVIWKTIDLCGPFHPDLLKIQFGKFRPRVNGNILSRSLTLGSVWVDSQTKIDIVIQ